VYDQLARSLADRYRIERELGAGGMATVYLAEDLKHKRRVALKVLKPELAAVLGAERFVQEITTTAALQHPHILPLFDSGEADGFLYYVMPFIDGETLRAKLDRETQLGIEESVKITTAVADALDYAHRHGVIHRDIKPENILLHEGRPVVADFGIALAVSAAAGGRMTETGLSLGTPHYMSPEQATAEREITARSDIYSLGSVLYEMLTGDPPHTGASAQKVIMKIITEPVQPVTVQRRSVPPNVAAAVAKSLEKLPADRFENAKAFGSALNNPAFTTTTGASSLYVATPARSIASWIRIPWSWAALGAIAALIVGVAAMRGGVSSQADVRFIARTFRPEAIFTARFAPDGQTIVFSSTGETGTVPRLYVIRPDYPEAAQLGPDSTHLLAISSKGELAVLTGATHLAHRVFEGTLATLPLGGGAPREVLTKVHDADWSPDGTAMAVIRNVDGIDRLEYPVGNVVVRSPGYVSDVRISPNNQRIAFFEHPARYDDRGSAVIVDRVGHEVARSPVYWAAEGLAWRDAGSTLLFSGVAATNTSPTAFTIYSMNSHGKTESAVSSAGGLTLQDVARNGGWLVTQDDQPYRLFSGTAGASNERELGWLDVSVEPVLSPDGSQMAFSDEGSTGGINYAVLLRKTDGSPAARIGDGEALAFSRDGKSVMAVVQTVPPRLMLYPTGPGEQRRLDSGQFTSLAYNIGGLTSGNRFFACGSLAQQRQRCWTGAMAGGALKPVTPEPTIQAIISTDGTMIVAQVADSFHVYSADGKSLRPALGLSAADKLIRWSPDGHEVWVWIGNSSNVRVDRVDPISGRRSVLLTITPRDLTGLRNFQDVTIADDGRRYAYTQVRYMSNLFTVERATK
jgi:tRNA A-37 threonylcarbamoyl transferase component Bud32